MVTVLSDTNNLKKARSGHIKVIDLLIDNKSDIMATTKNGLTPLHMARLFNRIITIPVYTSIYT